MFYVLNNKTLIEVLSNMAALIEKRYNNNTNGEYIYNTLQKDALEIGNMHLNQVFLTQQAWYEILKVLSLIINSFNTHF